MSLALQRRGLPFLALFVAASFNFAGTDTIRATEPALHERVDLLIEAAATGPIAPPASDADFVRRLYLDLTGVIPTADEARSFLTDQSPDKRTRLVDQLLASPQYARHMALTFDVLFMERLPDKAVKTTDWQEYLRQSFADNKPIDQLCRELIEADGSDGPLKPASRFLIDRECEPNLVTRDIGRMMFGMDLQCAQCHDHPLIDDYYQADYYGLFAFVHRSSQFGDKKKKSNLIAEKADGEASFKSVFTSIGADQVTPRLPKGPSLLEEPTFAKGEEYLVRPAKDVRPVPKFSRRLELAKMLASSTEFRRNWANRLWAHMFGYGIVHPVDSHHAANPPSHPQLLTLLADELAESKFDVRAMLRELALTRAYQRACDAPQPASVSMSSVADEVAKLEAGRTELTAQVEALKATQAQAAAELKAAQEQIDNQKTALATHDKALKAAQDAQGKATAEHQQATKALAVKKEQADVVAAAAAKAQEAVAKLPGDKVLAQASTQIAERSIALATELAAETKKTGVTI